MSLSGAAFFLRFVFKLQDPRGLSSSFDWCVRKQGSERDADESVACLHVHRPPDGLRKTPRNGRVPIVYRATASLCAAGLTV